MKQSYFDKVNAYFNDQEKTWDWFLAPNPNLSGFAPMELIKRKQEKKLETYIDKHMKAHF